MTQHITVRASKQRPRGDERPLTTVASLLLCNSKKLKVILVAVSWLIGTHSTGEAPNPKKIVILRFQSRGALFSAEMTSSAPSHSLVTKLRLRDALGGKLRFPGGGFEALREVYGATETISA